MGACVYVYYILHMDTHGYTCLFSQVFDLSEDTMQELIRKASTTEVCDIVLYKHYMECAFSSVCVHHCS